MAKPLNQQWKPCVLQLAVPENNGKLPFKAYAQYGEGEEAVYDINATMNNAAAAWDEAKALADAYNDRARLPSQCKDCVSAAELPAGTFLPQPPRNEAAEKALRDLIALSEEIARNYKGPR